MLYLETPSAFGGCGQVARGDMSFVPGSASADSHFPLQNLPYGIFSTADNVRHG